MVAIFGIRTYWWGCIVGLLVLLSCSGNSPAESSRSSQTVLPSFIPISTQLPLSRSSQTVSPSLTPVSTPLLPTETAHPTPIPPTEIVPPTAALMPTAQAQTIPATPVPAQCVPASIVPLSVPILPTRTPVVLPSASVPTTVGYQVVQVYPHDHNAFTEGLVYVDGALYEGTGLNGQSMLSQVDLATGAIMRNCALPQVFFGEGITVFGDRIIQLTWQSHIGFVYDKATFALLGTFSYLSEGWGLTHDDSRLIMSDGTATLHFLDPNSFQEIGQIEVYDHQGPVVRLNELEFIHGEIYANVWQTDRIARISPQTGQVLAWIDLAGLLTQTDRSYDVDVLNGIAYDAQNDRLFVTGKLWPKLFEIKLTS